MKLLIASDLHGSASWCRRLMEAIAREQPDRILLLGDLLYHGPRNGLPEDYDPKAVIAMLSELRPVPLCVRGNCEAEVDQMVLPFPVLADYCLAEYDGVSIFATHGHVWNETHLPPLREGDILLNGHTHIPANVKHENYTYMNPGSVTLPKEGSPHSYMLLVDGKPVWKDLDGKDYTPALTK